MGLNVTSEELRRLQEEDETLQHPHSIAEGVPTAAAGEEYFLREGLLYRRWSQGDASPIIEQLVLPKHVRQLVLELAHSIPMAGHLGKKKTIFLARNISRYSTILPDLRGLPEILIAKKKSGLHSSLYQL